MLLLVEAQPSASSPCRHPEWSNSIDIQKLCRQLLTGANEVELSLQVESIFVDVIGEMDGGTVSASAVSSIFTATIRISQVIYELKAVGEQTRDLLDSTKHVDTSLQAVRTLRRQKSCHLDVIEKRWIDEVLINTEKTLGNVATLIEPARVDMQTKFGRVGFVNRGLFVFRDSPKVGTNLSRLNLASQSLNTAMNILCTREGRAVTSPTEKNAPHRSDSANQTRNDAEFPPPYIESEFLNRRRQTYTPKRPITTRSSTTSLVAVEEKSNLAVTAVNVVEEDEEKVAETMDKLTLEDNKMAILPVAAVQEVNPTPVEPLQKDSFEGADGLQVCEATYVPSPPSKNFDIADGLQVRSADYVTSPRGTRFEGADGLEVCDRKNSLSSYTQDSQFNGADGLQVCTLWESPTPVLQESLLEVSQIQSEQTQQRQINQWHEQQSSYQQPPYPMSQDERLFGQTWPSPALQNQQWQDQHAAARASQMQNPPYPNSTCQTKPTQDPPYRHPRHHSLPYPDLPYPNPPYPNPTPQGQPVYQQSPYPHGQNQDPQLQRPLPPTPPPKPSERPLSSSDDKSRPSSIATFETSEQPISQGIGRPIARRPVPKPLDAHQPTKPPSSVCLSNASRPASQASCSSWAPSEVSQVPPVSTRKSRGRAWLEYQAER